MGKTSTRRGPRPNAPVTPAETELPRDIAVTVFKDQNGSLVDLEREVAALWRECVVHVGLDERG